MVALANSKEEFARSLKGIGDDTNVVSAERVPFITVVNIQKFDEGAVATDFDYDLDVQRVYFIDEAHRDYKRGGAFLTNLVETTLSRCSGLTSTSTSITSPSPTATR